MWKCIHRGLRTSTTLLKTDQSNGGCIVSSVINKEFDQLPTQPNTSRASTRVDASKEKRIFDGNEDSRENGRSVEVQIGDVGVEVPKVSFIPTDLPSKSATCNADVFGSNCEIASDANLVFCKRCHQIYRNSPDRLCYTKVQSQSWLSRKLHLHYPYSCNSSTVTRGIFQNHPSPCRPNYLDLPESKLRPNNSTISRKSDSLLKIRSPSPVISCLQPYYTQKKGRSGLEKRRSLTVKSQTGHNFTSCLLKLPFLSYDFMRGRGINQLYECLQNKGKTECAKDGRKGQKSERNEDSEDARKESWRRHHVQQSLLEAIGFSSALLLGWFLIQCRIWHPCGERHNAENQRRAHGGRCGMFSRLILPRVRNSHQPLNAVPSNCQESNGKMVSEEQHPSKDADTGSVDSSYDSINDDFMDDLQERCISNNFASSVAEKEISSASEVNQRQTNVSSAAVNEDKEREPIPMPWYPQESKQFGPITLEQAMEEENIFEETHAEALLSIAMHILKAEEGSDDESSAVELLTEAAHLGSAAAAFNLGICYEKGKGVTRDLSQAYYWYKVASDKGHVSAMYNLAIYHAQGKAGLTEDTVLALQLLERASSLGLPEAREALSLLTSPNTTENVAVPRDDIVKEHNHSATKSSSKMPMIKEESEASFCSDSDCSAITKTGTSQDKKHQNLGLHFGLMTESLLTSLVNRDEACCEIGLDNTQNPKQSDSKYASALVIAH